MEVPPGAASRIGAGTNTKPIAVIALATIQSPRTVRQRGESTCPEGKTKRIDASTSAVGWNAYCAAAPTADAPGSAPGYVRRPATPYADPAETRASPSPSASKSQ